MSIISSVMANEDLETVEVTDGIMGDIESAFEFVQTCRLESREDLSKARRRLQGAIDPMNVVAAHPIEAWIAVEGGEVLAWYQRNGRQVRLVSGRIEPEQGEG